MIVSSLDDNLIVWSQEVVKTVKHILTSRFDCEECGNLDEYVGCKLTKTTENSLKFA